MPAIHLIRKNYPSLPRIMPVQPGSNTYKSGNWTIAESTALTLIGSKIYFHRHQASPSFFGGKILETEKVKEGEYAGKIIFTLEFENGCRGVRTSPEGWAQEMKIIL